MSTLIPVVSPFALLVDPEGVLAAVHGSERLNRIAGRICRPLDRQSSPSDPTVRTDDVALSTEFGDLIRSETAP